MFRKHLTPLCLIGLGGLCVLTTPAWAQNANIQQLVSQGNYWLDQGREDLAADTWRKLLAVDARQPDALAGLGLIDLNQGRRSDAQNRLRQLQAHHPNAPQTTRLRLALEGAGSSSGGPLQEARRAAAAGRYDEAVKAYDRAFGTAGPPQDMALEYYQVLAGTQDGWARARDGLRQVVARSDTSANRLALAQVLTYRESTRREGIAQLAALSTRNEVATPARKAWRQALLWLNASTADAPLYTAFLQAVPNDSEIADRRAKLRTVAAAPKADPLQPVLNQGFAALEKGDLAQAESRFSQVLRSRPRDAQALGGLGSVRMGQERFQEAKDLLQRAAAQDGKWRQTAQTADYWLTLRNAGSGAEGRKRIEQAVALRPREPAGHVLLAQLIEADEPAAAERSYRKALELDADNPGALRGLIGLLGRLGRAAEAVELIQRLTPDQKTQAGGDAVLRASLSRARALEAMADGQLTMAQIELEDALLVQPADPWLRLDAARLYVRMGRPAEADQVMADLAGYDVDSADALHAQALYARERGQWQQAQQWLERIPEPTRSAEMKALAALTAVHAQADQARLLFQQERAGEAQLVLARAEAGLGRETVDADAIEVLAKAYADIGIPQRALILARSLLRGEAPSVESRLRYAGIVLQAGREGEASSLLRQLSREELSASQQRQLDELRNGYALRQVEAYRERGDLEGAYALLAPVLAQQPDSPQVIGALARLYAAADDHRQALSLYQQWLVRSPGDRDALLGAANTAVALRDLGLAERYLKQALAQEPQSPTVLAATARVYRAAGKKRQAEQYFRASLAAAAKQSSQQSPGLPTVDGVRMAGGISTFNPFAGIRGPGGGTAGRQQHAIALADQALGALPLSDTGVAAAPMARVRPLHEAELLETAPVDALSLARVDVRATRPVQEKPPVTVVDELRELRAESSSSLTVGANFRNREGEPGLGAVDELGVPMEGHFALGDGKLIVAATPLLLDAGKPDAGFISASRFGAGASATLSTSLADNRGPIDSLVGSSFYRLLLTTSDQTAMRKLIEQRAMDSGRYLELYNLTDGALKAEERRELALKAVFEDPLPTWLLSTDVEGLTFNQIASQLKENPERLRGLTGEERAQLDRLANGTSGGLTALELMDRLNSLAAAQVGGQRLTPQDAAGMGIGVGYAIGNWKVDVGTSPLGFDHSQVVGGVAYRGPVSETVSLDIQASRRAVTDSVLSFSGLQDRRAGLEWGGVTASGVKLGSTVDNGLLGGYANLSWHTLEGRNVADNDRQELGMGVYVHAIRNDSQSLTAGLNVSALRYDNNLSGFTYGHGGYFSPQSYVDVAFPVHWSGRNTRAGMTWKVDASVGVQHFEEEASPFFPTDPALQQAAYDAASLAVMLGLADRYQDPFYLGQTKTGLSYNLSAAAEWQLTPQLFLGGRMDFNNARDYRQFGLGIYLRFLLDRLGAPLGTAPAVLRTPYDSSW